VASEHVSNAQMTPEERLCQTLSVEVRQTGADPSLFLDALFEAMQREVWTALGIGSFAAFVANPFPSGMGADIENVRHLVKMKHRHEPHDAALRERMASLRTFVDRELRAGLNDKPGRPPTNDDNIIITERKLGTSRDYTLARLERDGETELLLAVERGEMSANQAAIEAGFRKHKVTVEAGVYGFARYIRKHFTQTQIEDLIAALREGE